MDRGLEVVLVTLPLAEVPLFNPSEPPPQTYLVEEAVQPGWIRDPVSGLFRAPTAGEAAKLAVPKVVSAYQAKAALLATSHPSGGSCYDVIVAFVVSPACPPALRLFWETRRDYPREHADIYAMARGVLNFPPETIEQQLDDLFTLAASIQ